MNLEASELTLLAISQNLAYIRGNAEECRKLMVQVFNMTGRDGGKILTVLDPAQSQTVSIALATTAMSLDVGGDREINEVAAENALYCCAGPLLGHFLRDAVPAVLLLAINFSHLLSPAVVCAGFTEDDIVPMAYMLACTVYDPDLNILLTERGRTGIPDFITSAEDMAGWVRSVRETCPDFSADSYYRRGREVLEGCRAYIGKTFK